MDARSDRKLAELVPMRNAMTMREGQPSGNECYVNLSASSQPCQYATLDTTCCSASGDPTNPPGLPAAERFGPGSIRASGTGEVISEGY